MIKEVPMSRESVHRNMYCAWLPPAPAWPEQALPGEAIEVCRSLAGEEISSGRVLTAGLFQLERRLFWYAESRGGALGPDLIHASLAPWLERLPGQAAPACWAPLMDVFHFNEPVDAAHWRRTSPVDTRRGRMARLKPDMVASYIYFHYQLQEERAFGGPKYEIIGIHENVLFGYQEFPAVLEAPAIPGRLATKGTPANWADAHMERHFLAWPDGQLYFKPMDTLYALG